MARREMRYAVLLVQTTVCFAQTCFVGAVETVLTCRVKFRTSDIKALECLRRSTRAYFYAQSCCSEDGVPSVFSPADIPFYLRRVMMKIRRRGTRNTGHVGRAASTKRKPGQSVSEI